jgi:hypothetical protein
MAKQSATPNQEKINRKLKSGRGQGSGPDYKPYSTVQDFSSFGQSNRDFGNTTERQHDYFSKIEHRYHLILDYSGLLDIQEQYPLLPIEKTIELARQCGIPHPVDSKTNELVVMTTDLRLTIPRPVGSFIVARAVKPSEKLLDGSVIEKLELERRYWKAEGIDWGIITERDLDHVLIENLKWSYKYQSVDKLHPLSKNMVYRISSVLSEMVLASDSPLSEIALECDERLGLELGRSLKVARYLIATRQWEVDMNCLIESVQKLNLLSVTLHEREMRKMGT